MHSTHEVEPEPTSKHPCSMFQGQCPLGLSSMGGAVASESGETGTLTHSSAARHPGVEAVQAWKRHVEERRSLVPKISGFRVHVFLPPSCRRP